MFCYLGFNIPHGQCFSSNRMSVILEVTTSKNLVCHDVLSWNGGLLLSGHTEEHEKILWSMHRLSQIGQMISSSSLFNPIVQVMTACLCAVMLMVADAENLALSHPLILHISHQVHCILNNLQTQHMTA